MTGYITQALQKRALRIKNIFLLQGCFTIMCNFLTLLLNVYRGSRRMMIPDFRCASAENSGPVLEGCAQIYKLFKLQMANLIDRRNQSCYTAFSTRRNGVLKERRDGIDRTEKANTESSHRAVH